MGMPRYTNIHIPAVVVALIVMILPLPVFAQDAVLLPADLDVQVARLVTMAIEFMQVMTWILFVVLTYLLDPKFIFDMNNAGASPLVDKLNEIWVLSRDLMNIGFAFILIGAAIYTVVRAKREFIAEYAPKFILSVILINFSWFVPRMILDVANVAAASVFGIPSLLSTGDACSFPSGKDIPSYACTETSPGNFSCKCKAVVNAKFFVDKDTFKLLSGPTGANFGWKCQGALVCLRKVPLDIKTISGHSAILNGLIVNHAHLQDLATVPPGDAEADGVQEIILFLMRMFLVLVIHIALLFPLLALTIAFAIRIPILWLTMAFMPFVFLQFVTKEQFTGGYPQKLWEHFLKAAFLPAIVAIPLSIGFILVNAGAGILPSGMDGISLNLNGFISNFWQLLWLFMTLAVFWVGVFSILEKMGIMGAGSAAIKNYGQSLGRLALKAPLAVPLFPGPGGKPIAPIAMFSTFHPRNIEAGISGQGGLADYFNNLKGGKGDPGGKFAAAADGFKTDPNKIRQLDDHIVKLTEAFKDRGAGAAQNRESAIKKIETDFNVTIDRNNIDSSLKGFLDKINEKGAGDVSSLRVKVDELKQEINRSASPTP